MCRGKLVKQALGRKRQIKAVKRKTKYWQKQHKAKIVVSKLQATCK